MIGKSERMPLADARDHFIAVASRSHLTPETETYIADLKKKHGSVELISSGSSIKICLVAEGKADVYPRFAPTMEWDTAAGHAIAVPREWKCIRLERGTFAIQQRGSAESVVYC